MYWTPRTGSVDPSGAGEPFEGLAAYEHPRCRADFNKYGRIDFFDIMLVLSEQAAVGPAIGADANGDGICDVVDYDIAVSEFGSDCGAASGE